MFRVLIVCFGCLALTACAGPEKLLESSAQAPTQQLQINLIEATFLDTLNPYQVSATWTYDPANEVCPSELLVEVASFHGGGASLDRDCDVPFAPEYVSKDNAALRLALSRIAYSNRPDSEQMLKQIRALMN